MEAAQKMDGVGNVTAGMRARSFEQGEKMGVPRASLPRHSSELSRGNSDRLWID
jgi:hypothetical protein